MDTQQAEAEGLNMKLGNVLTRAKKGQAFWSERTGWATATDDVIVFDETNSEGVGPYYRLKFVTDTDWAGVLDWYGDNIR